MSSRLKLLTLIGGFIAITGLLIYLTIGYDSELKYIFGKPSNPKTIVEWEPGKPFSTSTNCVFVPMAMLEICD